MNKIKKIIFSIFLSILLTAVSSANTDNNGSKIYKKECNTPQEEKQIQDSAKNSLPNKNCEKCITEDDKYYIYNQCYFDKQFRLLKTELNPDESQENCLNNIYLNFKQDLEIQCERYLKEKNKLLELIALDNKCLKEQKNIIKDIKQDIKEKYKDYISSTNEILCKNQKRKFKKFKRKQNKKIKQIKKYGAVYKFPCP